MLMIGLLTFSCQQAVEEEGHSHDEAGAHSHDDGRPSQDITVWTDKTELFVEFPALVVGQRSRFAAHFTVLQGHRPVTEGSATVSLVKDGKGIRQTVDNPASPGIFNPALQPAEAGEHRLIFELKTPAYEDRIDAGAVQVYATAEDAVAALGAAEEESSAISFLKEQAWKIDFQTAPVVAGEMYEVVNTSGSWEAAPGAYSSLTAGALGTVSYAMPSLTVGTQVRQGELLMTVSSKGLTANNLEAEIKKAAAELEQAKAAYERKKELYESRIVPKAELEQAESRYSIARAGYESLSAGYTGGRREIRAPFDGFVKSIGVQNGQYVEQGTTLLVLGNHQSHILQAYVSPALRLTTRSIYDIWYETGDGSWSSLRDTGGQVQAVGKEVEANSPMVPVFARVMEDTGMPDGSFTEVQIGIGQAAAALLVPESALLEEYGNFSVIVQLAGESFERRTIKTGRRNGSMVEVTEGLNEGEVVVSTGAYQVKMASMSGQAPAHGHAH